MINHTPKHDNQSVFYYKGYHVDFKKGFNMRNIELELEKIMEILDTCDVFDLTVSELNYFRKNYNDEIELIQAAYLFGYSQGMKGGE